MRDRLIDTAKGFGIILVVFGHINTSGVINELISNFHMPLFFFLSGAVLIYSKSNSINIKKKIKALLFPYWFFSLFFFVYWWFIESKYIVPVPIGPIYSGFLGNLPFVIQYFINILTAWAIGWSMGYDAPLWFLPTMFIAVVSYIIIRKVLGKYSIICCAICASVFFIGGDKIPVMPCGFDIAMRVLPLFWMGEKTYVNLRDMSIIRSAILAVIAFVLYYIIIHFYHPGLSMIGRSFGVWWQFYLMSFLGITSFILLCKILLIPSFNIVEWLGKSSIIILSVHLPMIHLFLWYLLPKITIYNFDIVSQSLWMSLVATIFITLVVLPFIYIINRYLPFIIGRKHKIVVKEINN